MSIDGTFPPPGNLMTFWTNLSCALIDDSFAPYATSDAFCGLTSYSINIS